MQRKAFLILSFALFVLVFSLTASNVSAAVTSWQKSGTISPRSTTDYASETYKQSVQKLASSGANFVTLIVPYYQSNSGSSDLFAGWNTPSDESLVNGINYAKSLGLGVTLKIHMETFDNAWRAYINANDRAGWFGNYEKILLKYAAMAQTHGVEQMCIGAEVISMASNYANASNEQYWEGMIAKVRGVYGGKLTYSAQRSEGGGRQWINEMDGVGFWDKLDYIGISGYYPLAGGSWSPTIQELVNAWTWPTNSYIAPLQQKYNKPIIFTEIGYRSVENANRDPWEYGRGGAYAPQTQANLYDAFMTFWSSKSYMQGVHLWEWSSDPNYGGEGNLDFTPNNKPAFEVMQKWFSGGSDPLPEPEPVTPPPPTPAPASSLVFSGTMVPAEAHVDTSLDLSAKIRADGALDDVIVDLEIYNANGEKLFQKFYEHQNFVKDVERTFAANWIPRAIGQYRFAVGVFTNNWSKAYKWVGDVMSFEVKNQSSPTPPPSANYTASATNTPLEPTTGEEVTINSSLKPSAIINNVIVDLELYNSAGQKVAQQFWEGQNIPADVGSSYQLKWTPNQAGTYKLVVGIFNPGWNGALYWNWDVKNINVTNVASPPTGEQGEMQIIEPADGGMVKGTFPLKALVNGLGLDAYKMYWRVDEGQLVEMFSSNEGVPHKEAWINVDGWHWQANGTYKITFVAKDSSGAVLGERTISFTILR